MSKLLRDFEEYLGNDTHFIFDDFYSYTNTAAFTTIPEGTATAADSDAAGGVLVLTANATDENQVYVKGTHEVYKFAADKPFLFAAKVKPVCNTIASANYIVGLANAVAADAMQDAGAGPPADYHGAVFFKEDAGTDWHCESSISTTQTTVASGKTVGNNAYDILVIQGMPISSTEAEVHFHFANLQTDGSYSLEEVGFTTPSGTRQFVAQTVTYTNGTEMQICLGTKAGASSLSCHLDVDWVYCAQKR